MPNLVNTMIVRELSASFEDAEGVLVVGLKGLTVAETESVRESLAERGVRLRVVRNRLARLALRERGLEPSDGTLEGTVGMAWGDAEAAIHAARVVMKSEVKKLGKLEIRGGILQGNKLDAAEAAALAQLPSRDELRAQLLGVISGPARYLVTLLSAPGSSIARVLQARVDKAGAGGEPGTEQGGAPAA
jgi:large subunit ribosomal protein L10